MLTGVARPNLHTLNMSDAPACLECTDCGHRGLLSVEQLAPHMEHNMQELRSLVGRLVCTDCESRNAKIQVPVNLAEAMRFMDGD